MQLKPDKATLLSGQENNLKQEVVDVEDIEVGDLLLIRPGERIPVDGRITIMVGTGRGAQLGVLFKNGEVLQRSEEIDTVVFDKTGTLTHGTPVLTDWIPVGDHHDERELLQLAASAEQNSEHALAEAVVDYAKKQGVDLAIF